MKSKLLTILAGIGLYLVSSGVSYAIFNYISSPSTNLIDPSLLETPTEEKRTKIDLSAPKTEACPLNNLLYTKAEKDIWSIRRPMGIMIENHIEARPQSGLSKADIVYEAVAEGGITRFMGIYLCGASAEDVQVGPVRSARTYFLDWISEYGLNPLYVHVGGANCNLTTGSGCQNGAKADALGQIRKYGWEGYNDINQFSVGFPTFWRDRDRLGRTVATEHTMYSTTDKLWEVAAQRKLTYKDSNDQTWTETYTPWQFSKQEEPTEISEPTDISYQFWNNQFGSDYSVVWKYNPTANHYLRNNNSQPHKDLNYDQQISAKNIIIAFMNESRANDGYEKNLHLLYKNQGVGQALVFKDGQVIKATWSKKDRTSRTKFIDSTNKEIQFNPGLIWISILPTGQNVDY
jgi:hypothetical protein